jgi:hypothetical protein
MKVLSVNVGLPREVEWKGKIVRTSIRADHFEFAASSGYAARLFSSGASRHAREPNYRITHGIRDRQIEHTSPQQGLGHFDILVREMPTDCRANN